MRGMSCRFTVTSLTEENHTFFNCGAAVLVIPSDGAKAASSLFNEQFGSGIAIIERRRKKLS